MSKGFFKKVYEVVMKIPKGKVCTYGQIAKAIGEPNKAKIVGWALHANPYKGKVPCHRVVNKKGELSGGFAFGGPEVQKKMLQEEGIQFNENDKVNLGKYLWHMEL